MLPVQYEYSIFSKGMLDILRLNLTHLSSILPSSKGDECQWSVMYPTVLIPTKIEV